MVCECIDETRYSLQVVVILCTKPYLVPVLVDVGLWMISYLCLSGIEAPHLPQMRFTDDLPQT